LRKHSRSTPSRVCSASRIGKAVGTYLEHKFQTHLQSRYTYGRGNSAKGIDFPELGVDIKVTSIPQPQWLCPFKSARQKIYGLGYSMLVFVYDKRDDEKTRTGGSTCSTRFSCRRSRRPISKRRPRNWVSSIRSKQGFF
jgi:hypothetical protein